MNHIDHTETDVAEFGPDVTVHRVIQLERIVARQRDELDARRYVAQQQRLRADIAEAALAELREQIR